jgi:hypothetical protein
VTAAGYSKTMDDKKNQGLVVLVLKISNAKTIARACAL